MSVGRFSAWKSVLGENPVIASAARIRYRLIAGWVLAASENNTDEDIRTLISRRQLKKARLINEFTNGYDDNTLSIFFEGLTPSFPLILLS